MMLRKYAVLILVGLAFCLGVWADTGSVLLLHTNDIHDYIKPGPEGVGGLPYVAGYVASMRRERDDILLLDAGDVMEKGDMVAFKTKSRIMYECMRSMHYDAGAVGNHDLTHGIEYLRECGEAASMTHLCLNYLDDKGLPHFPVSKIVDVKGVKVGIIGLTNLKGGRFLELTECGSRLAGEAERLEKEAHLIVVVAHIGSVECSQLSQLAPQVDVFVSGHTHETLQEPRVVPETGALIVQTGQYARNVGYLELTVDREEKKVVKSQGRLIPMDRDTIAPDREMMARVEEEEKRLCPEALEVLGSTERTLQGSDVALLAAAAMQSKAAVDIAFCHPGQIMRSNLPAGEITANSVFRAGGQRGSELVLAELTGAQIGAYVCALFEDRKGGTEWYGFKGKIRRDPTQKKWTLESDLAPDKVYRIVCPKLEWESRFNKVTRDDTLFAGLSRTPPDAGFTFIDAVTVYLRGIRDKGESITEHLKGLG